MTNAKKFEEVFGFYPVKAGVLHCKDNCQECEYRSGEDCRMGDWWNEEYVEKVEKQ